MHLSVYASKPAPTLTLPRREGKRVAFTLAEVLITLGIIGVVAALTLPTLIQDYQKKQTVTKLQKAMSILNQASRLSYSQLGEPDDNELLNITPKEYFEKYWKPYLNNVKICTDHAVCGYKSNNPFYTLKGNRAGYTFIDENTRIAFLSNDGFMFEIFLETSAGSGTYLSSNLIVVDINGGKSPNVLGKDVFTFERTKEGFVNTLGSELTDEAVNQSCSLATAAPNASNSYCAERIKRAGWEISDDYPW